MNEEQRTKQNPKICIDNTEKESVKEKESDEEFPRLQSKDPGAQTKGTRKTKENELSPVT